MAYLSGIAGNCQDEAGYPYAQFQQHAKRHGLNSGRLAGFARQGSKHMKSWTAPRIKNVNCGMEVTSYESSELEDEFLGARTTRRERTATVAARRG